MNKKLYAGISQILLGALVAIAPQTFAHVCAVKEMPMACHYTAQAALGIGIVIAVLGVAGLFVSNQTRAGLDIANAVLGVLTITVPTVLIGVWLIGSRLPMVTGISFTYVAAAMSISQNQGYGAVAGAVVLGGLLEVVLGLTAQYWRRFGPPIVAAIGGTSIGV